jgi:hypothetical protein
MKPQRCVYLGMLVACMNAGCGAVEPIEEATPALGTANGVGFDPIICPDETDCTVGLEDTPAEKAP